MTNALDVIVRGLDSSGRLVKGTRQGFQFYDRVNMEATEGRLVIVQGGWSNAAASANTHRLAMCTDYRSWNLSEAIRTKAVHHGRDLMGTMWYRSAADGFDPHIHNNLIGDMPADFSALEQVVQYKQGRNGLANRNWDRDPYRPKRIHNYVYVEDDMFEKEDHDRLIRIEKALEAEKTRDQRQAEREKRRFSKMVTMLGGQVDQLTTIINHTTDAATRRQLSKLQEKILLQLKEDPDVTEVDNPSDDALGERNMG